MRRTSSPSGPLRTIGILLEMIRFEHTIFALPFALVSLLVAARTVGAARGTSLGVTAFWVVVAMVGARSAAMAFNRIVDSRLDAANPRTARRAIPAGLVTVRQAWALTAVSAALFVVAAAMLNPLCLALSPVALAAVFGYSYCKRFTALTHLALGAAIGIAPVGAWLAVTGSFAWTPIVLWAAVMLWIGGFDIIYALQDIDFDRHYGLRSLPSAVGPIASLAIARGLHAVMLGLLGVVGVLSGLGYVFYAGVVLCAALLGYEHAIVQPSDLRRVNTAFFTMNGWVSVALLMATLLDGFV